MDFDPVATRRARNPEPPCGARQVAPRCEQRPRDATRFLATPLSTGLDFWGCFRRNFDSRFARPGSALEVWRLADMGANAAKFWSLPNIKIFG